MNPPIDYALLAKALAFYENAGFVQTEVAWTVPFDISRLTTPADTPDWFVHYQDQDKYELVGSAEQGFLWQSSLGSLPDGRFMAISPCFRVEHYDETHQPWFLKLELIVHCQKGEIDNALGQAQELAQLVSAFFQNTYNETPDAVPTGPQSLDLELGGMEIGSYGYRTCPWGASYVYGTGLALPRTTQALRKAKQNKE